MRIKEQKEKLIAQLQTISDAPLIEANELLCFATGMDKTKLLLEKQKELTLRQRAILKKAIRKRKKGMPLQYILGQWEFYSLPFKVGKGVLIPRAETEMLVSLALEQIKNNKSPVVFDLCAGSGAIGIAIAKNAPQVNLNLVEKSPKAFKYLKSNLQLNNITAKAILCDAQDFKPTTKADVIVSNPPYINSRDMKNLQREVKFEPNMALYGGKDGLKFHRIICGRANLLLKKGGILLFEIGYDEAEAVKNLMIKSGFSDIQVYKDLFGNDRVVSGIKTERKI